MRNLFFLSIILFFTISINAQTLSTEINKSRIVTDNGYKGVELIYNFPDLNTIDQTVNGVKYQKLYINSFTSFAEPGKPDLPAHTDLIAMPIGAKAIITIIETEIVEYNNYNVFPALKPATDNVGGKEPEFEIDSKFYSKDITFPSSPVSITNTKYVRGMPILAVRINPVQYNPAQKKLYVYKSIKYKIDFIGGSKFVNREQHSQRFLENYSNYFNINGKSVKDEINNSIRANNSLNQTDSKNYIIITTPEYIEAADSLAKWKMQLGYTVEIVSQQNWISQQVNDAVHSRYDSWTPKPDYLAIIGDNEDVPGKSIVSNSTAITTDLYYVCMDGVGDYTPDMAKGRISVSNASEAMSVIQKIINYERNPISDNIFYENTIAAAYFQDDNNDGYATRRFAQTSEEIKEYLDGLGYTTERAYVTGSNTSPTHWNLGSFSLGEALPSYLLKPGFAWNGNSSQINTALNAGRFILFHRDHGYEYGWGDPSYGINNINSLNNGSKLPVVFSINCLTGKFDETVCFTEAFLRKPDGGAVAIFGHAEVSYSGYNDGLALGLIDAIWPGLNANFTGYGNNSSAYTPHSPIYTLGDVANQGLLRMTESWGNNWGNEKYTHELFHYFGDPALRIWTANPTLSTITANVPSTILCSDTSLTIIACTEADALATIYYNGNLIAQTQLTAGTGTLYFNPFGTMSQNFIVTLSYQNSAPYITEVSVSGACAYTPIADFTTSNTSIKYCNVVSDTILLSDDSYYLPTSWQWTITPSTYNFVNGTNANSENPQIVFNDFNDYTISLIASNSTGSDTITKIDYLSVTQECNFTMSGGDLYTCQGIFYDDNIYGDYSDDRNDTLTIYPLTTGNLIEITFNTFDIENSASCNYDYLEIYDGTDISANLIGRYCGATSPGTITANNPDGALTFVFHSNLNTTENGWEASISCSSILSPVTDFNTLSTSSCDGIVNFTDLSTNAPSSWSWNFGDGTTSTQQNPTHTYLNAGIYNVSLVSSNIVGTDSIIKTAYVTVTFPDLTSVIGDSICGTGNANLQASGAGTIYWYNSDSSNTVLATGNNCTTPYINTTTVFYAEDRIINNSVFGGKTTNFGSGDYLNATGIRGFYFDCLKDVKLVSIKVYSNDTSTRNIILIDNSYNTLYSQDFNIPIGESRLILNWNISQGHNYEIYMVGATGLYGNTDGATYPYIISDKVKIISAIKSHSLVNYNYFYDWEVANQDCYSTRVPVTAYVEPSAINDFNISANGLTVDFYVSSNAISYYWDFGDGTTSTQQNPTHTYSTMAQYTVSLTVEESICTHTILKDVFSNNIEESLSSEIHIYPNPASTYLIIEGSELQVESYAVFDIYGRNLTGTKPHSFSKLVRFNVSHLQKGIYFIKLKTDKGIIVSKFIKK